MAELVNAQPDVMKKLVSAIDPIRRATDELERAEKWLKTVEPIKSPNRRHSSYGYKDMAEKATGGYIMAAPAWRPY